MRITDALKPVTDARATAGVSLESATYKDGKIHATLIAEAPKATGKPGSGPEFPPEGYRLVPPDYSAPVRWSGIPGEAIAYCGGNRNQWTPQPWPGRR